MKRYLLPLIAGLFMICATNPSNNTGFNSKDLDKKMVKVSALWKWDSASKNMRLRSTTYALKYEVSNSEYNEFLNDLKAHGKTDDLKIAAIDTTKWNSLGGYNDPMTQNYHKHLAYADYPVVNISYEGAVKYCEWLTERYNQSPKRKYQKVLFRLPTESDWINAANPMPGHNLPWYGNFAFIDNTGKCITNVKFRTSENTTSADYILDGGFYPLKAGSFPPNKSGIYDVIGNVAEMLSEKGKTKGGSWDNFLEECTVYKTQQFDGPDPRVGFRVFMEVIE